MHGSIGQRHVSGALLFICLALAGCSQPSEPADPQGSTAPAASAQVSATAPDSSDAAESFARRADAALREQRLFAPEGDNAFELLLAARAADPDDARSRYALADLVPYAVLEVEQRTAAGATEDAERLLALIERADAQAPALPRLRRGIEAERQRVAEAAARAVAAAPVVRPIAEAPAPPAAAAPAASAAVEPEPAPATTAAPARAEPPAAAARPADVAEPVAAPAPAPAPAQVSLPEVVFRPPLRYPPMAERRRIEGEVELEFTINADGSVGEVRVLRAQPEGIFDREAIGAMERWRFAPPSEPMRARRVLEFRLAR